MCSGTHPLPHPFTSHPLTLIHILSLIHRDSPARALALLTYRALFSYLRSLNSTFPHYHLQVSPTWVPLGQEIPAVEF